MVEVHQVLPVDRRVEVADLMNGLAAESSELSIFDERVIDFVADLSRRLRRHPGAAELPALTALSYWIRPANIRRMADDWARWSSIDDRIVRVPQGVVFHLPPTNVDTLFVYSWLLSALTGNANVIRLSPSVFESPMPLLDVVGAALTDHDAVGATTAIVTYGHEAEVTRGLSTADVRVIWGGDDTVEAVRAIPAVPSTSELAFPDRYSMALIDTTSLLELDDLGLNQLTHKFFNDAYWFDQMGCASPRLLVWRGRDGAAEASQRFRTALREQIAGREDSQPAASTVIAKLVHASDLAAGGTVTAVDWSENAVTIGTLEALVPEQRDSPGGGLFYEVMVDDLAELVSFVRRKDQTLSHFGFPLDELRSLAVQLGSRGIDRIVPIGDALTFGRFWDGQDLLVSFTRALTVQH